MKRSEINAIMQQTLDYSCQMHFSLPPFARFSPEKWASLGNEYDEVPKRKLGWDITDFGSGDFEKIGLVMFTIRNGDLSDPHKTRPYCEKLLVTREEQVTPTHYHMSKAEDIINRGGGNLVLRLYNARDDGGLDDTPVTVLTDGRRTTLPAGGILRLTPGESVTLLPRQYHAFWGEKGCGTVLIGEVSSVNDDEHDNFFYETVGRFPEIEEDVQPQYLLCGEYPVNL